MTLSIPSGYTKRVYVTQGDDDDYTVTLSEIPAGQSIAKAWFVVKPDLATTDDAATIFKPVTTDLVAGRGQITDDGSTTHKATVFFEFPGTDTATLTVGQPFLYDIQLQSSAGKKKTVEQGVFTVQAQVNQS